MLVCLILLALQPVLTSTTSRNVLSPHPYRHITSRAARGASLHQLSPPSFVPPPRTPTDLTDSSQPHLYPHGCPAAPNANPPASKSPTAPGPSFLPPPLAPNLNRRACQLAHHKLHRKSCGILPFSPPSHLATHEAFYENFDPRPSFLYFPSPDSVAPVPIHLSPSTAPLVALLRLTSSRGLRLATTLLYSLLLEGVEERGGTKERLLEQLEEEYGFEVAEMVRRDEEPEEGELMDALGGEENLGLLCE